MYQLLISTRFKKDLKKIKKNANDYNRTRDVLKILKGKGVSGIERSIRTHILTGKYKNNFECHIKSDLLIIWIQIESPKVIKLVRIGSHSDLFK